MAQREAALGFTTLLSVVVHGRLQAGGSDLSADHVQAIYRRYREQTQTAGSPERPEFSLVHALGAARRQIARGRGMMRSYKPRDFAYGMGVYRTVLRGIADALGIDAEMIPT